MSENLSAVLEPLTKSLNAVRTLLHTVVVAKYVNYFSIEEKSQKSFKSHFYYRTQYTIIKFEHF